MTFESGHATKHDLYDFLHPTREFFRFLNSDTVSSCLVHIGKCYASSGVGY